MDLVEPPELPRLRPWRTAVWSLRVGYVALVVALVGLVVMVSGHTPWVLAAGVVGWLACAVVTVTAVLRAHARLPEPRPGLWPMRFMLLRDTARPRPHAPGA